MEAGPSAEVHDEDAGSNEERGEAGAVRPSRSAEPKAEGALLDGGIDPACTGAAIDLAVAIADTRCAIDSTTAKALRAAVEAEDAGVVSLKQEAKRTADGKIELRVVNHGAKGVVLPLSWHPKVAAFMVLADSPTEKAVYELEAPRLEVAESVGAKGGRFARVLVPPGGAMLARMGLVSRVERRVDKKDAGAGATLPASLSPGKWTLHVAQFVCDVEVGEPAILSWDIEAPH